MLLLIESHRFVLLFQLEMIYYVLVLIEIQRCLLLLLFQI
jgi:hypothetical protein